MIQTNKIYLGDCLDIMKSIDDNSVDLIVCDLPYGITKCAWDIKIPLDLLWKEYLRIIKRERDNTGTIILFGTQPFSTELINSNRDWFKYEWVWNKHIPRGFQTAKYKPMQLHENILVFGKTIKYNPIMTKRDKPVKVRNYSKGNKTSSQDIGKYNTGKQFIYTHKNPNSIIEGCWEANNKKIHPTQKPVSLIEYLIKTYTSEGDIVLDNCSGSGSTAVACLNTNRKYICIEKNEEYYNLSVKRVNKHLGII